MSYLYQASFYSLIFFYFVYFIFRETAMAAKHSFEVLKDKPIERVQRSNDFKDKSSTSNPGAAKVIDYFDFSTK